ncbi:hypothetical protein [Microvirga sp. TS319]|uniref:hypothetical protein n=1 Tax=Microvirga sp. TS319 TaxID=3241165 RepID=UPI00351A616E
MIPRLSEALQAAYEAFGRHSLSHPLEACHCESCMSAEVAESILKTPLRELSNDQLSEYTNSAHGWSDQFLYLLPRYMELIAQGDRPTYLDADSIFSRFRDAPENCLTPQETYTLGNWLTVLFEETLHHPISNEELACALARQNQASWNGFGNDVCEIVQIALPTPFDTLQLRALWEACQTREAALRMASAIYFGLGARRFNKSSLLSRLPTEAASHWYDWFTREDHTERLSRAYEREMDPLAKEFLLLAI